MYGVRGRFSADMRLGPQVCGAPCEADSYVGRASTMSTASVVCTIKRVPINTRLNAGAMDGSGKGVAHDGDQSAPALRQDALHRAVGVDIQRLGKVFNTQPDAVRPQNASSAKPAPPAGRGSPRSEATQMGQSNRGRRSRCRRRDWPRARRPCRQLGPVPEASAALPPSRAR